jgi:hypothetical protein
MGWINFHSLHEDRVRNQCIKFIDRLIESLPCSFLTLGCYDAGSEVNNSD